MPKQKQLSYANWLQISANRVGKLLLVALGLYAGMTILYDAFNLITPDRLLLRWILTASAVTIVGVAWYISRSERSRLLHHQYAHYVYIGTMILFAASNVYLERGMASKSVFLFLIPLVVSTQLLRRSALYLTALLSTAAYSLAMIWYFVNNPAEGYKVELYGEMIFYSVLFFCMAALLWGIVHAVSSRK